MRRDHMAQYSDRQNRNVYIYIYILLLFVLVCKLCAHWNYSRVVGVLVLLVCKIWVTLKLLMELLFVVIVVVVVVIHLLLRFALLSHVGGCWRLTDLLWSRKKWVHWVFGCKEGQVHSMLYNSTSSKAPSTWTPTSV